MVLADTSVWVQHLRHKDPKLGSLLQESQVLTHPFIIGELACGQLTKRPQVLSLLHALPQAPIIEESEFMHYIERHKLAGAGVGFVDVHLLASCELFNAKILTYDKKLHRIAIKLGLEV